MVLELFYGKPHLVYMQCSYVMQANADCQEVNMQLQLQLQLQMYSLY